MTTQHFLLDCPQWVATGSKYFSVAMLKIYFEQMDVNKIIDFSKDIHFYIDCSLYVDLPLM